MDPETSSLKSVKSKGRGRGRLLKTTTPDKTPEPVNAPNKDDGHEEPHSKKNSSTSSEAEMKKPNDCHGPGQELPAEELISNPITTYRSQLTSGCIGTDSALSSQRLGKGRARSMRAIDARIPVGRAGQCFLYSEGLPPPGLAKTGYKFKSKDLVRFNFTSLEYIGLFRVLSAAALNRLYIAPTKNRELNLLILSDEIETHHPQGRKILWRPAVGDVALAKKSKSKPYTRVVVEEQLVGPNKNRVMVREVDTGLTFTPFWAEMKWVNEKIMQIPVVGFEVELSGVPAKSNFILQNDFETLIKRLQKIKFKLSIVEKKESHVVGNLIRTDTKKDLGLEILELEKWTWERILELGIYRTDNEIANRADWKSCPADFHCADFPKDVYFRAEVVADVVLPTDPQKFICVYLKPDTKYMEHLEKVLESQVERYMKMVQPSNFYPAINENVFILPPSKAMWYRMIRFDQVNAVFYSVDTHEFCDISPSDDRYQYRRIPPDFTRIPKLILEGAIVGVDIKDAKVEAAVKNLFTSDTILDIQVREEDLKIMDDVLVIRCAQLDRALDDINYEKFLSSNIQ